MYFGRVGKELSKAVKKATGYNFEGKNVTLRTDNVRKILKDHGIEKKEAARGQRAISENNFANIPRVISEPDNIKKSIYDSKPAAEFVKTIDGSRITVIAVDSGGSLDLYVQTMYAGVKKGSIASMANADALTITPETSAGTASTSTIRNSGENAKKYSVESKVNTW